MESALPSWDTSDDSATTMLPDSSTQTTIDSRNSPDLQSQIHATQGHRQGKSHVGFILTVITTAILGVYTFSAIAGEMPDPALSWASTNPPFALPTLKKFLAAAFVCFTISMSLAVYNSSELAVSELNNKQMGEVYGLPVESLSFKTSIALHAFIGVACVSLGLISVAYVGFLGWAMIAFTCLVTGTGIALLCVQRWTYLIPPNAHID